MLLESHESGIGGCFLMESFTDPGIWLTNKIVLLVLASVNVRRGTCFYALQTTQVMSSPVNGLVTFCCWWRQLWVDLWRATLSVAWRTADVVFVQEFCKASTFRWTRRKHYHFCSQCWQLVLKSGRNSARLPIKACTKLQHIYIDDSAYIDHAKSSITI